MIFRYKILAKDSFGRITSYISGNGLVTNEVYNEVGLLKHITTGYNFNDAPLRSLSFEYDELGNP